MSIDVIDPNLIPSRDTLIVALICGATKAGIQKDRKKEKNKKACRGKIKDE